MTFIHSQAEGFSLRSWLTESRFVPRGAHPRGSSGCELSSAPSTRPISLCVTLHASVLPRPALVLTAHKWDAPCWMDTKVFSAQHPTWKVGQKTCPQRPFNLLTCQPSSKMSARRAKPGPLLLSQGCHNKILQTGGLSLQKYTVSQFWRLEVTGQGVGTVGFLRGLSLWPAGGHLLPVSS